MTILGNRERTVFPGMFNSSELPKCTLGNAKELFVNNGHVFGLNLFSVNVDISIFTLKNYLGRSKQTALFNIGCANENNMFIICKTATILRLRPVTLKNVCNVAHNKEHLVCFGSLTEVTKRRS